MNQKTKRPPQAAVRGRIERAAVILALLAGVAVASFGLLGPWLR